MQLQVYCFVHGYFQCQDREREQVFCISALGTWPEYLMLKAKSVDIVSLPQTQQLRLATENRLAKVPLWEPGDLHSDRGSLF